MRRFLFWALLVGAVCAGAVERVDSTVFGSLAGLSVGEGAFRADSPRRQLEKTAAGVRLRVDVREQAKRAERYVLRLPPRVVTRSARLRLTVRFAEACGLLSGVAGVRVRDAHGETFHYFPSDTFQPGDGTTVFSYDIDEKTPLHWGGDGDGRFGSGDLTLAAVTFSVDADAAPSDAVELLALEEAPPERFVADVAAMVETGGALPLVWEDAPGAPSLCLTSRTDRARRWTGDLWLSDFFGARTRMPVDLELPPKGTCVCALPVRPGRGHWRVSGTLSSGEARVRVQTAFAVLPRPRASAGGASAGFRMGVNFHSFSGYDEASRAVAEEALTALGTRLVRGSVGNFRQVAPRKGEWRWEKTDRIVAELVQRGIGIHAIVYSPPAWAIPEATRARVRGRRGAADAMPDLGAYADYLRRFAERYDERIDCYEIGNEWDDLFFRGVLSPEDAIALQKTAYAAIKGACPRACVIHSGFCTGDAYGNAARKAGIDRFLKEAFGNYDRHAVHIHGPFGYYERQLDEHVFPYRERLGLEGVPWYSDESAHTSGRATEACVAATVWKKILHAQAMGSADYIWYNLRACGGDAVEQGYGLLAPNFEPRPSFVAFAALERLVGGLQGERPLERRGFRRIYRLHGRRDGRERVVVAGWDAAAQPAALELETDADAAFAVDLMGRRTALACADGRVRWTPGRLPSAVLLEGATFARPPVEAILVRPAPTDWSVTLERADETNGARTAVQTVCGAHQAFAVSEPERARCETLTDGTNRWDIAVETTYAPVGAGGFAATVRIENRTDRWRVVGFSGGAFALSGVCPTRQALYVPEGLGKRVNPIRDDAQLPRAAAYDPSKWQDAQWFRAADGGAFFGTGWYPGAMGLTMPFVALADEAHGVYLGQHDPEGKVVRLELAQKGAGWRARAVHRTPIGPGEARALAETVCRPFDGDWHVAAELYRAWRASAGRLPQPPDWIRRVSGWLLVIMRQQNGEVIWPYGDMARICDVADANGLDMIGLFGWTEGGHDHLYPEYRVSDEMGGVEGLKAAIRTAHRRGKRVCLYANGQLQEVGGTDFWRADGCRIALEDRAGDRHLQYYPKFKDIPKYAFALGCLHAPAWERQMLSLAEQACDLGADGILYDQLGMTRPWLCYGAGHGHPVPANSYEAERPGFLRRIRAALARRNPSFVLMTEGLHDTIADAVACFHGCETGCFQTRLSWEPAFTQGADAWTRAFVRTADARFRADPGVNTVFPELYRFTFPEMVTTVRIPSPLADRTMVNWSLLFGLRHDIELRYAPDRAYALDGRIPSASDFATVCSPSDVARMRSLDRRATADYLRRANAFQKRFASLLLDGCFADERGVTVETAGNVLAKRFRSADGATGVLAWNLGSAPVRLGVAIDGRPPRRAAGLDGDESVDAPLAANSLRLYLP